MYTVNIYYIINCRTVHNSRFSRKNNIQLQLLPLSFKIYDIYEVVSLAKFFNKTLLIKKSVLN